MGIKRSLGVSVLVLMFISESCGNEEANISSWTGPDGETILELQATGDITLKANGTSISLSDLLAMRNEISNIRTHVEELRRPVTEATSGSCTAKSSGTIRFNTISNGPEFCALAPRLESGREGGQWVPVAKGCRPRKGTLSSFYSVTETADATHGHVANVTCDTPNTFPTAGTSPAMSVCFDGEWSTIDLLCAKPCKAPDASDTFEYEAISGGFVLPGARLNVTCRAPNFAPPAGSSIGIAIGSVRCSTATTCCNTDTKGAPSGAFSHPVTSGLVCKKTCPPYIDDTEIYAVVDAGSNLVAPSGSTRVIGCADKYIPSSAAISGEWTATCENGAWTELPLTPLCKPDIGTELAPAASCAALISAGACPSGGGKTNAELAWVKSNSIKFYTRCDCDTGDMQVMGSQLPSNADPCRFWGSYSSCDSNRAYLNRDGGHYHLYLYDKGFPFGHLYWKGSVHSSGGAHHGVWSYPDGSKRNPPNNYPNTQCNNGAKSGNTNVPGSSGSVSWMVWSDGYNRCGGSGGQWTITEAWIR